MSSLTVAGPHHHVNDNKEQGENGNREKIIVHRACFICQIISFLLHCQLQRLISFLMKYILLLACLCTHPAWSQTKGSTQPTEIQALQKKREALSVSVNKIRADASGLLYRQEEADKVFFENLTTLDSLEGKRLQLKELPKPTPAQKKQLDEIVNREEVLKNRLSGMEMRRQTLKDRYNSILVSLDKNVSQLQQLDEEIARRKKKLGQLSQKS